MTFGYDARGSYRVCSICGKKQYEINFADKIKLMSVNELSEFFAQVSRHCGCHPDSTIECTNRCKECWGKYLSKDCNE